MGSSVYAERIRYIYSGTFMRRDPIVSICIEVAQNVYVDIYIMKYMYSKIYKHRYRTLITAGSTR